MANQLLSPKSSTILAALQCQGQRNDCGPFTTATVINALKGTQIDALQLAEEMNRPRWRGPLFIVRRVPNWATFPWGMVDVLRQHGLNASWRAFANFDQLRAGLTRGDTLMPIQGEWKPLWAHVMTLVAFDDEKGWGFANTQYEHHDVDWWSDEKVKKLWGNMAHLLVEVKMDD
jgi:hypothetical protein